MRVKIPLVCPKHEDIKQTVLLSDYTEALDNNSRDKKWFCKNCGRRLLRFYGDLNFLISEKFNTRNKGEEK